MLVSGRVSCFQIIANLLGGGWVEIHPHQTEGQEQGKKHLIGIWLDWTVNDSMTIKGISELRKYITHRMHISHRIQCMP